MDGISTKASSPVIPLGISGRKELENVRRSVIDECSVFQRSSHGRSGNGEVG
ncbi:unnamed protein product [Leuciscus chuanchicus]